jgi:hypothetical protein
VHAVKLLVVQMPCFSAAEMKVIGYIRFERVFLFCVFSKRVSSQSEMLLASKNGDISCLGVAFSRQQVERFARSEYFCKPAISLHFNPPGVFLSLAFTTLIQEQKVYVQHIIPQHARHLAAAVSSGACIIVCGAAQQMPKAVFAAISQALATGSNISIEEAEDVLKGAYNTRCHRVSNAEFQAWSARKGTCSTHGRKLMHKTNALLKKSIWNICHSKSEARMARLTALVMPANTSFRGQIF